MKDSFIYHICTESSWESQIDSKEYIHDSLLIENFIHCSQKEQIEGVLSRYFEGQTNLLILTIDPFKVIPKIRFDEAPNGEEFPHIYGALNKGAIIKVDHISGKLKNNEWITLKY